MRVFVASGIFYPEAGGPATHLHGLLPALQRRGHEVSALAFGEAGSAGPYPLTRIPRRGLVASWLRYRRAATRLWPGHDVAYVHGFGLPLPAGLRPRVGKIVADQAWERAVNRGWVPPTTDVEAFRTGRHGVLARLNRALYYREARRLDRVVVPSQYLRRVVTAWGVDPARVTVVYNAVDPAGPAPVASRAGARAALGLPDEPVLLTVCRLTAAKGVDLVIRAAARLATGQVVVAGDGPARPGLEALARRLGLGGRVCVLGYVPRERLPLYYRAADYTLLYSGYEGLSHVLLESLRAGTPVIASDRGGNGEVVRHGENGFLVPYPDPDALATALERALAPGEQARCAAQSGLGLERFSWERMVDATVRVLAAVA